ncbi:MAG: hypothetical protein H6662_07670 [Ardenticatenaceae bacterium]|nr:hypothetical protein [Anaerolineales bacterium]MCB8921442.1 hypothetical protein [Ardenticatenaceae bacterium]MCB8991559.1 hypothetical protein [Ardenticatenaceae bacterium]
MKKTTLLLLSLLLILVLAACGTAEETSTDVVDTAADTAVTTTNTDTAVSLTEDYAEDALPIRNQLLVGTMKLEGTDLAVTPEQASELLVLWQASIALSRSGTGATEEVTAVLNQIEATMTPEQIAAIADMQLTREDIQAISQEMGLSTGSGDGEGAGGANRGQGQNLTGDDLATREAERTDRASSGATNALLDTLIELLTSRSES